MDKFQAQVKNIAVRLASHGLKITGEKPINYGIQLKISDGSDAATLNIYNGKKGVTFVVQGSRTTLKDMLQNIIGENCPGAANAAGEKTTPAPLPNPAPSGEATTWNRPPGFEDIADFDEKWIGIDESGKGDFFGSLVAAAVMVDSHSAARLETLGVKDSKTLSDPKNAELAQRIRESCQNRYTELKLPPPEYNRLYGQYRNQGKNLNDLLGYAHAQTLEKLLAKEPCRFAIADQFGAEKFTKNQLLTRGKEILLVQMPRGERNIAVAAASVLARDIFLEEMKQLREKFGISFPKGAVNVLDAARLFTGKYGRDSLPLVCKTHFRTYEQI